MTMAGCYHHDGGRISFSGNFKTTKIHGSGLIAEEHRPVKGFTAVTYSSQEGTLHVEQATDRALSAVNITLVLDTPDGTRQVKHRSIKMEQAAQEVLLVRAEDNLLPYLITEVHGDVLHIRTTPKVDLVPTLPIEFFLTVTSLESLIHQGVGDIDISGLTTDKLVLKFTGVGAVEVFDLNADELNVWLSGLGSIGATGNVIRQTVKLTGMGPYQAQGLQSSEAEVVVESSDSATVRVSDLLIATIKSTGSVYYIGSPTVEATITGTGKVEQITP
jgi:hypothetical protein